MELDPRGLEAAIAAVADSEGWNMDDMPITIQTATSAITAYLTAIGETHVLVPRDLLFDINKLRLAAAKEGE